jgi:alpha-tubulin suppressor-like RCC1 family protein
MTRRFALLLALALVAALASLGSAAAAPTPAGPVTRAAPLAPRQVRAVAGNERATLTWRAPASGARPTGYRVQRRDGGAWVTVRDLPATARRLVVRGLTNGQTALLRVAAIGNDGRGAYATASVMLPITLQITAGDEHNCALRPDRTVVCFGYNRSGQLGDGTMTSSATPVPVRTASGNLLRGVTSIDAGGESTCAVTSSGRAWCWGENDEGNLSGDTSPTRANATPVVTAAGVPLRDVRGISVGADHTCMTMADGTARCMGSNTDGQLGRGTALPTTSADPLPVTSAGNPLRGVVEIGAGSRHTCARLRTGAVVCVGDNTFGQLGVGDTADRLAPTPMFDGATSSNIATARSLSVESAVTCVHLANGTGRCSGYNLSGALGNDTLDNGTLAGLPLAPTDSGLATPGDVVAVSTSGYSTCLLQVPGRMLCTGDNSAGELFTLGIDDSQVFLPTSLTPTSALRGVASVATGYDHTCVRLGDGSVRCAGDNREGQLGIGTLSDEELVPVRPIGL